MDATRFSPASRVVVREAPAGGGPPAPAVFAIGTGRGTAQRGAPASGRLWKKVQKRFVVGASACARVRDAAAAGSRQ